MFKSSILCASILCAGGMVMAATTSPPGPPGITPPGPPGPPPGPQPSITPPGLPGPIILPGPQALFCPKDGTWKQIGPAPLTVPRGTNSGQVLDIAIDPSGSSDSTIYVATNGGIWKTTDGGSSWDTRTDCLANVRMGAVALDAGNPSVVYAGTGNFFSNGGVNQPIPAIVYKSYDAGWSWWPLSLPSMSPNTIRMVSPAVNQLLVGNNVHDDFHALVFSPPSHVSGFSLLFPPTHTDFYVGNDGGIAKTSDGLNFTGVNGTAPHGIATNLFGPPIDIGRRSATNNQFIYGGMQDTGTGVHRPDLPALEWDMTHGGDGDQVAVDPTNPKKSYAAGAVNI